MEKLVNKVLENFQKDLDIKIRAPEQMKYLNAYLEEALCVYPPVLVGLPQVTPNDGLIICGQYIPGKVWVSVAIFYHSSSDIWII